jgi:hypothetical protein
MRIPSASNQSGGVFQWAKPATDRSKTKSGNRQRAEDAKSAASVYSRVKKKCVVAMRGKRNIVKPLPISYEA